MDIIEPILSPKKTILTELFKPIRRLYDWTVAKASHRHATWYLAFVAFANSSFFPIPPDVLLIAMGFAERRKSFWYAALATFYAVLGSAAGYAIGYVFYQSIGIRIVQLYQWESLIASVGTQYEEAAFVTVLIAAFTPIPDKVITISAGLFHISFIPFIVATLIGRAGRYLLVAALIYFAGAKVRTLIEKYFEIFSILFAVLFIGGFVALKYLG